MSKPVKEVKFIVGEMFDREPPHSAPSERAVLGSMIVFPDCIPDVLDIIKGDDDFYDARHATIYRAIRTVEDKTGHATAELIAAKLEDSDTLEAVGGMAYLKEVMDGSISGAIAPHYAEIVAGRAMLRRLIEACGRTLHECYHAGENRKPAEVLDRAEGAIFKIGNELQTATSETLNTLLTKEFARMEASDGESNGLKSGFRLLDEKIGGFRPGEMSILAARPSMGKSALATTLAEQVSCGGLRAGDAGTAKIGVAMFSLEMSRSAVTQRLMSAVSGIPISEISRGCLDPARYQHLMRTTGALMEQPIEVDDSSSLTVTQLRSRARRLVDAGARFLIVDYLQLLTDTSGERENRQAEVSSISRGIKALARELQVPILCLSQLNRANEARENKRPRMSDLRESGSLEQDADLVMLLHREDYYHDDEWKLGNPHLVGEAELIIAKQRNGPTGTVPLRWDSTGCRFLHSEYKRAD